MAISKRNSEYWVKKGEISSLSLFYKAATGIPAYKDFLRKKHVDYKKITTWKDFQNVPPINKKNYLSQYKLKNLTWQGKLNVPLIFTATSGSTGKSFFFARNEVLDWQYSVIIEDFIKNSYGHINKPTLAIICFGMGVWIGGLITYKAIEIATKRNNFPISIITPGINKKEIINILSLLLPNYEQLILAGYPPFVKDIIDEAISEKINLKKYNPRIIFAAEAISEEFRDYISKKAGIKNIYRDIINIYGSADIGAMAYESSISTLVKRLTINNRNLFRSIFPSINKFPTLAQFNSQFINFEAQNGEILLTGDSAIPLIRYAIGDKGGVFSFEEISKKLNGFNIDLYGKIIENNLVRCEFPFIYIYERIDLSTTFYGMWIYPEWFRSALLNNKINKYLTGKFTLITKYDKIQNQSLEINLELRKNIKASKKLESLTLNEIIKTLRVNSSEYRELSDKIKHKAAPILKFWVYEDPLYFKPGIKQKWVNKN